MKEIKKCKANHTVEGKHENEGKKRELKVNR